MKRKKQISNRVFASAVILTLLFNVAFLQRILPITGWNAFPGNYTVDGEAILTNVDGYYYLNAAKEILNGTYSTVETHRATPDIITRSSVPPLLSVLTAAIAKISGISVNWIGAMLPAILSLFIAFPIFFLGWRYGGAIAATTAVGITLLAPAFLMRNNFGFYDTDCLNAFFPYTCAVFFLLFAVKTSWQRYLFLAVGVITALLFLWWWDQTFIVPLALGYAPLCMALLFLYRPNKKECLFFITTSIILCAIALQFIDTTAITTLPESIKGLFLHISKQSQSLYPPISVSIAEQAAMSWQDFSRETFAFPALFPFAVIGVAFFIYRAKKEITLFLPLIFLAAFTFIFAKRFVIFSVPLLSIGFGMLLAEIFYVVQKRNKKIFIWGYALCAGLLLIVIGWKNFQNTPDPTPVFTSPSLTGMKSIQKLEKDAVIWSWWDQGHPLIYWGEKDTINDGMVHDNERTHCNAVPLIAKEDRFAANYMNFYISRGKTGIHTFFQLAEKNGLDGEKVLQKILAAGPGKIEQIYPQLTDTVKDKIEQLLFPKQNRTIYLFLDMRQTNSHWIHFFGSWNSKKKNGQKLLPGATLLLSKENKIRLLQGKLPRGGNLHIEKGDFLKLYLPSFAAGPLQLSELTITTTDGTAATLSAKAIQEKEYSLKESQLPSKDSMHFTTKGQYTFDINLPAEIMFLWDKNMAESVSNRLFWRNGDYDSRYFSPVELHQPYYQIWKVRSDMDNRKN